MARCNGGSSRPLAETSSLAQYVPGCIDEPRNFASTRESLVPDGAEPRRAGREQHKEDAPLAALTPLVLPGEALGDGGASGGN